MSERKPNLLFIMADQLAFHALSWYGNRIVKTPHLDTLAAAGVVFDNAYCPSPLCAPSRYALMSGRLPAGIGAYDNAAEFAADIPTYAHYLRLAGFRTALSGKMHFCGPDGLHGFEERLTTDIYPADYGWFADWDDFETRPSYYHNMSSVTQAGVCVRSNQLDFDDEVTFQASRFLYAHVRQDDPRPFALTVSFTHPHDPYATPQAYWDRYRHEDIPMPTQGRDDVPQDPHALRLRHVSNMDATPITDDQIRNARHAYYGNVSYVDDQIGRLLAVLEETGQAENTIIVFSGDHGDHLGERGLWYKMSWYEPSARVPMLVHAPGRLSPRRVGAAVSTIDLLPTFLELVNDGARFETPCPLDGRSLLPHLQGLGGHDEVIGEYLGEGAIAPLCMIRRERFKYVCSTPDPDQLFDLIDDPNERNNLAGNPAYEDVLAAFQAEAAARWDMGALRQSVVESQRRRRLVHQALMTGQMTSWDFQPKNDASRQYMRNTIDLDDLERLSRFPRVD